MGKKNGFLSKLKKQTGRLKRELTAVYLCLHDPRVPLLPKILIGIVIGYALSPIDLIPDFIPVIGLLDDLILIPLGIRLAIRLIPPKLFEENRKKAAKQKFNLKTLLSKKNWIAAAFIIILWGMIIYFIVRAILSLFKIP